MIKTVLFDLDGTIIDTNELIIASFMHTLQGITPSELTREHIIPHMGKTLEDQLMMFSGRDTVEDLIERYREFNLANHAMVTEFPYVLEVVKELHKRGIKLGVVTTKVRFTTEIALKQFGLYEYMDTIVTIQDVVHPKPHPEPVQMAMAALQANPKTTMMIGDSQYDILSAKQAGAVSVGVAWSLKGEAHLRSFEPNYIIQNMLELLELVETEL